MRTLAEGPDLDAASFTDPDLFAFGEGFTRGARPARRPKGRSMPETAVSFPRELGGRYAFRHDLPDHPSAREALYLNLLLPEEEGASRARRRSCQPGRAVIGRRAV